MPDDFSAISRGISYSKGEPQGPPLANPQKDQWKLDVFSVEPPLEKLEEQQRLENAIRNAPVLSRKAANSAILNDFYKEAANISVATKDMLSAMQNIFSGESDTAVRRLDRCLKILSEIKRSIEDEVVIDKDFPVIVQDSLEKAIRDTEASLGHAEAGEASHAAKKLYDAHSHLETVLSLLI